MDDDLIQLEAELKRLRPAAPRRDFLARLERELATPPVVQRPSRAWWLWAGAALPVAAALALAFVVTNRRTQSPAPAIANRPTVAATPVAPTEPVTPAAFKPVAAENVLLDARDEGFVTLDDGTAARRERLRYVDTFTWKNPRTNASVRWSVPREEVRVVPVVFQ